MKTTWTDYQLFTLFMLYPYEHIKVTAAAVRKTTGMASAPTDFILPEGENNKLKLHVNSEGKF